MVSKAMELSIILFSVEDQSKAKKKAIKNLKKDPLHYYNLISGESSKVDKHDGYKETKRGKLEKDTFNDMKKATLKERKERLVEGTRALVGYLAGDTLTTTYNHYDGYPSNLGKGLEAHYNNDDAAKDIAMKGYITGMDAERYSEIDLFVYIIACVETEASDGSGGCALQRSAALSRRSRDCNDGFCLCGWSCCRLNPGMVRQHGRGSTDRSCGGL